MTATILIVEDDLDLREALCDTLGMAGHQALGAADGREALEILARQPVAMIISDVQMQGMDGVTLLKEVKARHLEAPFLLMTAYGSVEQAVHAMQDGAVDYLLKPFEAEILMTKVAQYLPTVELDASGMVAVDESSRSLMEMALRVAPSDATVMIAGESGTGKEVMARFIHEHSARGDAPFVAINCAAIPENMLEAVLFGYEKGAFTGAYKASPGKFEQAQGGTLLLDEVSEMDLGLQAKLLRVLQEQEVERLGGQAVIPLDVRVLATTNRDLKAAVGSGIFREDLYYRLNVFPVTLAPLRQRPEDIIPLAEFFMGRHAERGGQVPRRFGDLARQALMSHAWPGNARELDNVVQRALILAQGNVVGAGDLHFESATMSAPVEMAPAEAEESLGGDLKERERELILSALSEGRGSRKFAAEKLGISPRTLRYKLARMRESGVMIPEGHAWPMA